MNAAINLLKVGEFLLAEIKIAESFYWCMHRGDERCHQPAQGRGEFLLAEIKIAESPYW